MPNRKYIPIPILTESEIERFQKYILKLGDLPEDCHLWTGGFQKSGLPYGKFSARGVTLKANRVSFYIGSGNDPGEFNVCHNCPNGDLALCVRYSHLWLGTTLDNNRDTKAKGRTATGDRNGTRLHPESRKRGSNHHVRINPLLIKPALDMLKAHPELRSTGDRHWTILHPEIMVKGEKHVWAKLTEDQVLEIRLRHSNGGVSYVDIARDFNVTPEAISCIVRRRTWKHV